MKDSPIGFGNMACAATLILFIISKTTRYDLPTSWVISPIIAYFVAFFVLLVAVAMVQDAKGRK